MAFELDELSRLEIANVAQVPLYSPLRYPGGKSRWYPFAKRWLQTHHEVDTLVEPFAGGASIGLAAGIEGLVDKVVLVETNEQVANLWETIFNGDCDYIIRRVKNFDINERSVNKILESEPETLEEKAFRFLLRNRVSRGGITAEGAGILKNGENGKGLSSRWYPDTLSDRIYTIRKHKDRFDFIWADGITVIKSKSNRKETAFFVDPPYPKAGGRLYDDSAINHKKLLNLLSKLSGPFMATYDTHDEIINITQSLGLDIEPILTKTTHHEKKHEVLISRDFSWVPESINTPTLF